MKDVNQEGKKVAVIGSRNFSDKERLFKILDNNKDRIKVIVSGGAQGADSLAQEWAKERGFPCLIFYPRWKDENGKHDRGAGFRRNRLIINYSDVVLAFWDEQSRGTKNSIDIATQLNKPVKVFKFTPPPEPVKESTTAGTLKAMETILKEAPEPVVDANAVAAFTLGAATNQIIEEAKKAQAEPPAPEPDTKITTLDEETL
jgi:predicted Rossmann fold nucleotide-binding protein DprA/Smf involved in DNA uptake